MRPPVLVALAAAMAAAACGSNNTTMQTGSSTGSGGSGGGTGGSGGGPTALSLPQFVHGAARVDSSAYPQAPVVIEVTGAMPDSVEVTVDGVAASTIADSGRFVATVDVTPLDASAHTLIASARRGGNEVAKVQGTLTVSNVSAQFTDFSQVGPAYAGHLVHDVAGDALAYTWVSVATGKHQLYLNRLDGAFTRIMPSDVVLNDPADEPVSGYTAFGKDAIGAVYHVNDPASGHWRVKMRITDSMGAEKVPAMDLTAGQAAFALGQAGVDPGGFSAAWLHITPATDPNNPPPVELRFARWDLAASKLVGPITLDSDQPQPAGSSQGPLALEPLAEMSIACNDSICLVAYTRDVYNALVLLDVPKIFVAVVDLSTGQLAGTPTAVSQSDWDTQMFGQHLVALDDRSFVLVYTSTDTAAAVQPKSPCDDMLERDLLRAVKIDATGKLVGKPKPVFDFEGTREYPRVAAHPAGFALFWEDQRSECQPNGHIRMGASVASPDLVSLLDPYTEIPGSIALPPEDPTLAVTGTNFVVGWSDNRHGMGLTDPKPELTFDTYWRK